MAPWTPADIGTGLIAWYDFADTATVIKSGSFLTQWRDKSGNNRHGNAMSAGTLSVNADGIYIANATSGPDLAIQMPSLPSSRFDFAFAGKPNPAGSYRTLMAQITGGQHHMLVEVGTNNLGMYANAWVPAGSLTWPPVDAQVYFSGPDASNNKIGKDGAALIDLSGEDFNPGDAPVLLNYNVGGGQGFGTAREFVFMTAGQSQDIRDKVSGYLAWKWDGILDVTTHVTALPSGHPYKSAPPEGEVVGGGGDTWDEAVALWDTDTQPWDVAGVEFTVTGLQATTSVGTVTPSGASRYTISTGQQVAVQLGDETVTGKAVATLVVPQQAVASVGDEAVRGIAFVYPTGQQVTTSVGDETVRINMVIYPIGFELNASVGEEAIWSGGNISFGVAGFELTASAGTPSLRGHANVYISDGTGVSITPPVYRTHTFVSYAGRPGGLTFDKPVGTVENDIMLAYCAHGRDPPINADIVAPAGWAKIGTSTVVADTSAFTVKLEVWWKRAGPSEPATYFFDVWGGSTNEYGILSYSNCTTTGSPIDGFSQSYANNGSTSTVAGIDLTQPQAKLVWIGHNWNATGGLTAPVGMTERLDHLLFVADETVTAAGATGVRTMDVVYNQPWATYLIALKGAGSAGGAGNSLGMTTSVGTVVQGTFIKANITTTPSLTASVGDEAVRGAANSTITAVPGMVASVGDEAVRTVTYVNVTGQSVTASVGTASAKGGAKATVIGEEMVVEVDYYELSFAISFTVSGFGMTVLLEPVELTVAYNVDVTGLEMTTFSGVVDWHYGYAIKVGMDPMVVQLGRAISPNWSVDTDEPNTEHWTQTDGGPSEGWIVVPGTIERSWVKPSSAPDEGWTKKTRKPNEWIHG